jgi:predicted ATPase
LFVSGEAGIGKTRLLREIAAALADTRQIGAVVFQRDLEAVGGLILDLALELGRSGEPRAGAALRDRLLEPPVTIGDVSRGRRMLVADLAATITSLLADRPTLLRIEDLHWADELSLDVLERVAGGLGETPSMLIGTYRSDELYPRSALRRLRTRLLEQRLAEEVRLPRLDAGETAALVESLTGRVESATTIRTVFDRSDGIPLHIEELVAGASEISVPETVADAVGAQKAMLAPQTQLVVEAASVIGRSFDLDLPIAVAGIESAAVDVALKELGERYLVLPGADGSTFDFRHALIRDAIYDTVAPLRKRSLHSVVARAALEQGFRDAYVSDQFERAHEAGEAYRHALDAARDARRVSAHREAVDLFRPCTTHATRRCRHERSRDAACRVGERTGRHR